MVYQGKNPNPAKKLKLSRPPKHEPVQDLSFDPAARQDYLTGFHKRKVERKEKAQSTAQAKEKEERVRERREVSFWQFLFLCAEGNGAWNVYRRTQRVRERLK